MMDANAISWTPEMDQSLTAMWLRGMLSESIGKKMGLTGAAVRGRAWKLKLPNRQRPVQFWTEEREKQLREYVEQGLTAPQIVKAFEAVTSSQIRAKLHRLGLKAALVPLSEYAPRKNSKPKSLDAKVVTKKARPSRSSPSKIVDLRILTGDPIPIGPMGDFSEPQTCKWIHGDVAGTEWRCCGHETVRDSAYCETHHKRSRQREPVPVLTKKTIPTVWLKGLAA